MGKLTSLGRLVSVLVLSFMLIAFINGVTVLYVVVLLSLALLGAASAFAIWSLRDLSCSRELSTHTVHSGDPLQGTLQVRERRPRWRLLEVLDAHENRITGKVTRRKMLLMTDPRNGPALVSGTRTPTVHTADGGRETAVPDTIRFARRGTYQLGPLVVRSHDPLGLLYVEREITPAQEVIVYPHPIPVPDVVMGGIGGRQDREVRPFARAGESSDFHGIRPYAEGDDLRRVHWKVSAHTGTLAIKEYEYRFSGAVEVVLDLQRGVHVGEDDYSTLEAGVTLAASVLNHVIGAGNQAGLLTTGEKVTHLPQESGRRQLHRALETLALAKADGDVPLARALASDEARVSRRCTAVVITPSVDMALVGTLLALRGRSAQVLLVLLDASSFAEAEQEARRPKHSLLALATQPIDLKKSLQDIVASRPAAHCADDHCRVLAAAQAAGISTYPIGAGVPLHEALQAIRGRM